MSRVLAKRGLEPHPDSLPAPFHAAAKVSLVGTDVLKIEFVVLGPVEVLDLPSPTTPEFRDELWRQTCFEAFVGSGNEKNYVEYNASPARHYAIYRFENYRAGMQPGLNLPAPDIWTDLTTEQRFDLTLWLDLRPLASMNPRRLGLSAVLKGKNGRISHWALAHPEGKADFHHPDGFQIELPPT